MSINFNQTLIAKKGFTLIELLVVTAIIGVLAIISATVFNSILRSQNKTTIVNEIRQNGNLVIDKFERDIRGASKVTCIEDMTVDPPTSCSSTQGSIIMITPTTGNKFFWYCTADQLVRDGESLLNRDPRGGVKTVDCNFNVTSSRPQLVLFHFTLEQRNVAEKAELQSEGEFQTTISTRNYQ